MDKTQALERLPHLASPAALAVADSGGKWREPPHLRAINAALVRAWGCPNSRLAVSVPFQHGKSVLCSNYFPAWVLLLWPETRIALASYSDEYAAKQGAAVREIVSRYGPALGVSLREDTRAKDEWVVDFTGVGSGSRNNWLAGGMVCKGRGGALTGRAADLLILDDMIKNPLSVDTPIPTPVGWKLMGQLKVGDEVFSNDGTPTTVTSVSQRWTAKRNRIKFGDGSHVDAHPDHKWTLFDRASHSVFTTGHKEYGAEWWFWATRGASKVRTVTTSEIASRLFDRRHMTNWVIPNTLPLQTENKTDLLVDPYVLGVWLGDGHSDGPKLTSHIDDVSHYEKQFASAGYYCRVQLTSPAARAESPDTRVVPFSINDGGDAPSHTADSAAKRLKHLGVIGDKHVPPDYLRASESQRMALLCGLMDTDGTVSGGGGATFCNTNKQLIDAIHELLVSLGAKATITRKENDYEGYWLVTSTTMFCPFTLPRKVAKWEEETGTPSIRRLNRTVVAVEELSDEVEYVCISVDTPSHLYLAGRGMIPTHNSEEAQSPAVLDGLWDWYCTVAFSRLGPTAPVISVSTRWGPKDLVGRWESEAKVGGEQFEHVVFPAIAGPKDLLGRKPGEALWPERVPLARLEMVRKRRPRWFEACWQGNPVEGVGLHFQPKNWPRYVDTGDAWRIKVGFNYHSYRKAECFALIAIDWAQRGKKDSDKTAFVAGALTPDGQVLILDTFNQQVRQEGNAPALAAWCQRWRWGDIAGLVVASDDDMLSEAMVIACRQHRAIPDIKRLGIRSRSKLIRAQSSIIRSQDGKFLLPESEEPWYAEFEEQLRTFTGAEGAEDDLVDCVGILGRLADDWYPAEEYEEDYEPLLGSGGYISAF